MNEVLGDPTRSADTSRPVSVVVDVANVMGSRPDGWWRDRAAAALRLVSELASFAGSVVEGPDGGPIVLTRLLTVVEGRARGIPEVPGAEVVRAEGDGDDTVLAACLRCRAEGERVLVVTADRGLRARLPEGAGVAGPRWLLGLLGPSRP